MLHGLPEQVCAIDRKVSSKLDRIVDTIYTFGHDASWHFIKVRMYQRRQLDMRYLQLRRVSIVFSNNTFLGKFVQIESVKLLQDVRLFIYQIW